MSIGRYRDRLVKAFLAVFLSQSPVQDRLSQAVEGLRNRSEGGGIAKMMNDEDRGEGG